MTQSEIVLTPMTGAQVSAVADLERQCFSDPWSEASIRSELDNPLSLWLVALDGDRVVGFIGSQTVLGEADILSVAVAPARRRQGIARRLLTGLRAALARQGVRSLTLEVRPSNEAAIALYASLGYVRVGRRPSYYCKPREDALILRKEWTE